MALLIFVLMIAIIVFGTKGVLEVLGHALKGVLNFILRLFGRKEYE